MSYDEPLVGTLSIVLSTIAVFISVGPWDQPYELRTIQAVRNRYGKPVARGVWAAIALAAFTSGTAILSGLRPAYAEKEVFSFQYPVFSKAKNPLGINPNGVLLKTEN